MASTATAATAELSAEIEAALANTIERGEIRAAVAGVYADGKTRVFGFGQIGRHDEREPDIDTVFEIGSISKVFTALLTQLQVDGGRLAWDDPIGKHLGETKFASSNVAAITLRELASHTSGLPRIPDNMQPEDPLDPYAGYDRDDLLSYLAGIQPDELRKTYDYSNLGAGLLGLIAGDAAGPGYAKAMSRDVLRPIGMDLSSVGPVVMHDGMQAQGYSQGADMPGWAGFDALAGAGAIVSTAGDLLRFISANFADGSMASALEAIREPQAAGETALGWHIEHLADDDPVFWHNGGTGGFASFLALRPRTGTGIVLLTSSTSYALVTDLGMAQIAEQSLHAEDVDLRPYPGSYMLTAGFVLTVFVEDGRLYAQATGQGRFGLTPSGTDEFVYPAADIRIVFERAESGRADKLTLHQGSEATEAPRVSDEDGVQTRQVTEIDPAALEDYAGRYQLGPRAIITVESRDGQLYAQLTGQAAFPVFPYESDRFFYKVVDAQLHFERDDDGEISALVLHQGGQQRAPKIQ